MVCGTSLKNVINRVEPYVLCLDLLDDLLVLIDSNSYGSSLYVVTLACGSRSTVILGCGICETSYLYSTRNRITGQIGVLQSVGKSFLLDVLDNSTRKLCKVVVTGCGKQNA